MGYEDEEKKNLSYINTMNLFIRGIGGFESGNKKYKNYIKVPKIPKRKPDAVLEVLFNFRKLLEKIKQFFIDFQVMIIHYM